MRLAKLGQKVQRAAEKHHVAPNRVAAGQAGDGLGRDRGEHRGGQVGVRRTLVQQRLQVGFGEDPAARRDRVEMPIAGRQFVQPLGVGVQQARHLVDEGSGAAGAGAVHALLDHGPQKGDLRVLAAERPRPRRAPGVRRPRWRPSILDERHADHLGDPQTQPQKLPEEASGVLTPVELASLFHYRYIRIHPF